MHRKPFTMCSMTTAMQPPDSVRPALDFARVLATAVVPLLAVACSVLQPAPVPDQVLHVLDPAPAAAVAQDRREMVLEISPPRASPGFESPAMLYVKEPFVLDRFAIHRWADSPARMLGPLLTRSLERSGGFRTVVEGPTGIAADIRLDTELLRLQQNFIARPSRIELSLRVQLVDLRNRRVVATRTVDVTREAPTDDPAGGVAGANAALADALAQTVEFCLTAAADVRPRPSSGR